MDPEHWRQIEQLYQAALEKHPAERGAFLAEASDSEEVRNEVASLLAENTLVDGPLDRPAWEGPVGAVDDLTDAISGGMLPGTQLGPYQIDAMLGAGGMGIVYRARDTRLKRHVAIKFLSDDLASAAARRRFQREAEMASALNHPHILTVHDSGEFQGRQYLVTEFVAGGTLRDWSQEKRTWRQILELLVGVADGLAAAHAVGILHRDIKPANILISANGYAKLADFGLAKVAEGIGQEGVSELTDTHTLPGAILGTIAYMSPEQASAQAVDARSDIFSFGTVLYELLASQRPFPGATNLEVVRNIITRAPDPLPQHLPAGLRAAVEKALRKNPEERYQSMSEMVVDLKRAQRLSSDDDPQLRGEQKSLRRRTLTAFAVAVVLIAIGVLWLLRQREYFWQNPLAGARIERLTDFEGDETDVAISADAKLLAFVSNRDGQFDAWVGQTGSGEFTNLTKGRFVNLDPSPIRKISFNSDGGRVWISDGDGQQTPYTGWLASPVGGVLHPFLPRGIEVAWSPDASRLVYHTDDPGDPIFVADRNGSNPRQIYVEKPGGHCHHLTWSADGRFIYFVKGSPTTEETDIWRVPVSAGGSPSSPERITRHNARVASPAWLDARTLIYSGTAEDDSGQWLYTIDVERRIPHRVTSGIFDHYLSVAVSATRPPRLISAIANPTASLWTIPFSEQVQTEAAVSRFPVPNTRAHGARSASDYLLFLSSRGGADGIWKMENGAATELWKGSDGGVAVPPGVSPDGSQICFSSRKQGRSSLDLMNANGTNIRPLAESLEVRRSASWSPDGNWVAVAATVENGSSVFLVPVNGGSPVRLVDTPSYNPVWSPDGRFIIYSEPVKGGLFALKAITPEKAPVPIPEMTVSYTVAAPYRFVPGRQELIFIKYSNFRGLNFYCMNLQTGQERQLTDLKPGFAIQSFDVSADGKNIIFDRLRENSDLVLMDLPR